MGGLARCSRHTESRAQVLIVLCCRPSQIEITVAVMVMVRNTFPATRLLESVFLVCAGYGSNIHML